MKPSIPQGTRDFSSITVQKRQYIFSLLKNIFETCCFQPIETPAMENLLTLTGKYGEEGDRLIFKILNNGLHEKKDADKEKLQEAWQTILTQPYSTPVLTERALRYDLTIPFARYVVMHQHELAFPFRRYQMQPVWRADRPQKGRYREFWQCDCDIVGTASLTSEAELLHIYQAAFRQLHIPEVTIKVNNRKILSGMAETAGFPEKMSDITIALDKLDKAGWESVTTELRQRGIPENGIDTIKKIASATGDNHALLNQLEILMADSDTGLEGIRELRETLRLHAALATDNGLPPVKVTTSLARGLNYYTGFITEVTTSAVTMGSIGGGGRYDDLTGLFGLKGISGVGISFGIDRIYDVLEELKLFPEAINTGTQVLLINTGEHTSLDNLQLLQQLRKENIAAELYPDPAKLERQLKYADKRQIPFVILAGEEERQSGLLSLKNMHTREQELLSFTTIIQQLTK